MRTFLNKLLWTIMILLWAGIVYEAQDSYYQIYASYPHNNCDTITTSRHTEWELRTRSIFSSISLFAFNIDSNAIDGWIAESNAEDTQVSETLHKCAVAAGAWTLVFVFILLFKTFQLWFWRIIRSMLPHKNLYVFWGINQRSIRLAEELNKDILSRILFVTEPADMPNDVSQGLSQILHRSRRRTELQNAVGLFRASVLIAEKPVTDYKSTNLWTWFSIGLGIMWGYMFLTCGKIHVMLLGDDETKNIYDSLALSNRKLWGSKRFYNKLSIHCLARRSNANRVIEDVTSRSVIEIIDSSHLAIELLKQNPKHHPINFVRACAGMVYSPFRCLLVGFSECGQDALRFLYEYSAFVDFSNSKSTEEADRSPFYCDIVDKQLDASAARWMHHAHEMFRKRNSDGSPCISFHPLDYNSQAFYTNVLDNIIGELNYVVIAVGNDRAGIALAIDILRYAIRTGRVALPPTNTSHRKRFRIYVRSYNPDMYEYLKTVASYYNEGGEYITIFGAEQELYTKQMLIDESIKQHAMYYQYNYHIVAKNHFSWEREVKATKEEDWEERRTLVYEHKSLDEIQNLRRQESQDYANALHLETKKCLKFYGATPLRLAQTEHLRWIAAHEIMGYSSYCPNGKDKDILHYGHSDMIPWKELKGDTREYDFLTFNELFSQECLSKAIDEAKQNASNYKK